MFVLRLNGCYNKEITTCTTQWHHNFELLHIGGMSCG